MVQGHVHRAVSKPRKRSGRLLQIVRGYRHLVSVKIPETCALINKGLTFQVKEDIGLVVLEHLSDKLHIHVLDVDVLYGQHSQFMSKWQ